MNSWFENDFKLLCLEDKMRKLKEEFDKTNNENSRDYNVRLNRFLSKSLGEESQEILGEQILLIASSIKTKGLNT